MHDEIRVPTRYNPSMTIHRTPSPQTPTMQHAPGPRGTLAVRLSAAATVVASFAAVICLAVRPISSNDIGYHLAYGDVFLDTGRIVDDDSFIHPRAEPPTDGDRPALAPGGWFDDTGRLRFPNATWLSQVIFSAVLRWMGWNALSMLAPLLVAVILLAQAGAMRRLGVGWGWVAFAWLGTGLVAYERFVLRPELLGYACMAIHLWLLCGEMTRRRLALVLLVQLIAVNVHSYWVMNVFMFGAFAGEAWLRLLWNRHKGRAWDAALAARVNRLTLLFVLAGVLSAVHPAGIRNSAMPLRTLAFLNANDITGQTMESTRGKAAGQVHPWALIGEFYSPLGAKPWTPAIWCYIGLLAGALPVAAVLAWKRQWALLAMLGAFMAASWSMRRNIAPAAIMCLPLWAIAAKLALDGSLPRGRLRTGFTIAALPALALAAGVLLATVTTNRFYEASRLEWRFGAGKCLFNLPISTCEWLDAHLDADVPVFVDYTGSSNIMYFSKRALAAPVLTNTWSMTVDRMRQAVLLCGGKGSLDSLREWDMDVAVIQLWPPAFGINRLLDQSPDWAMVFMDCWFVVYARRTPQHENLIRANEITRAGFDVQAFAEACRRSDPSAAMAYRMGAMTLHSMEWFEHSEVLWRLCLDQRPDFDEAWLNLGVCIAQRGEDLLTRGAPSGRDLMLEAGKCFERCLELDPANDGARKNLNRVRQILR